MLPGRGRLVIRAAGSAMMEKLKPIENAQKHASILDQAFAGKLKICANAFSQLIFLFAGYLRYSLLSACFISPGLTTMACSGGYRLLANEPPETACLRDLDGHAIAGLCVETVPSIPRGALRKTVRMTVPKYSRMSLRTQFIRTKYCATEIRVFSTVVCGSAGNLRLGQSIYP